MLNAGQKQDREPQTGRRDDSFSTLPWARLALSLALRGARIGWWSRNLKTEEVAWSTELEALFEIAPGSFAGTRRNFLKHVVPEDRDLIGRAVAQAIEDHTEFSVEFRFVKGDGSIGWMEGRGLPQYDEEGNPEFVYGVGIDITDRIRDELEKVRISNEVKRTEARFKELIETATVGIIVNDSEGVFLFVNQPLLKMLGYCQEDVERRMLRWSMIQAPDRVSHDDLALEQLQATGKCEPYETEYIRRDGSRIPVYVGAAFLPGETEGTLVGAAFVTDLSRLKEAQDELISLNEDLDRRVRIRTSELEEAYRDQESYNYSISHDLRAPLRAIVATARIIEEDHGLELSEGAKNLLRRQVRSANRLGALVDDLLNLSRVGRQDMQMAPVDLTSLARDVVFEFDAGERVVVEEHMFAVGDEALLRLVWQNLLGNALKFSPPEEHVEVGTIRSEGGTTFYVKDNGIGFDMSYAHRLFLPFERLVKEGEFSGSGIGLTNVEKVIQRHHGHVWAESHPGAGATFYFTIPQGE
jgi:PAS domain S-box-containing protein